ncbi:hypothetical protein JCM10908_001160 [Rhodotorula pacifica]|uniref:C2H2-type zinc finger protein n=1 Tax=Rhodotorula pacifica TaxID=1495444 RepID=UPI003179DD7F
MDQSSTHPYTCLSCQLAFVDAHSQRQHYSEDLHRYNSRRRVAGLPPVTQETFDDKVRERTGQLGGAPASAAANGAGQGANGQHGSSEQPKKLACKACNKTFASQQTHDAHMQTKKHKDMVLSKASKVKVSEMRSASPESDSAPVPSTSTAPPPAPPASAAEEVKFESSGDAALDRLVSRRLQYAPPIAPSACLFCSHSSASTQDNVQHMRAAHSFVIPEEEYLVDLEGLLRRLGEEVGTWNVCVCCGKGYGGNIDLNQDAEVPIEDLRKRASKGVEAVRAHMQSKSHCRLKYDTEDQQLEIADFYDFRPSYPDYAERQARKAERRAAKAAEKAAKKAAASGAAEGWEDVEEDAMAEDGNEDEGDVEVVYEEASASGDSDDSDSDDSDDDELPSGTNVTYGDTNYELVLPSGARIGHRAHRNAFKQNALPYLNGTPFEKPAHASQAEPKPSAHSQALLQLVPAMMKKDRTHAPPLHAAALVPAKGAGYGRRGASAGEVIKARNKGEAKHAGKATREFADIRHFQKQANIRGEKGNNQKHFRDFLLQ